MGSIRTVTTSSQAIQTRYHYDAWGKQTITYGTSITNRGYLGEEHLPEFGLVNLNARMYDLVLGRFMGVDPYVQSPGLTQSHNRYTYGMNNPMSYIDPDGEFWWFVLGAVVGVYLGGVATNNGELNPLQWDYKDPMTYLGVAFGRAVGATVVYRLVNPGMIQFGFNVSSQYVSIGTTISAPIVVGDGVGWNFQWSTAAGGGGLTMNPVYYGNQMQIKF